MPGHAIARSKGALSVVCAPWREEVEGLKSVRKPRFAQGAVDERAERPRAAGEGPAEPHTHRVWHCGPFGREARDVRGALGRQLFTVLPQFRSLVPQHAALSG